ncbi:MAG TPA: hypothetical protein VG796_28565 [Verrucomicrobiales bacterium]|jgi:hypothetical protein|nr:hypothetical protein [Verrucomicrobiales bacterium]
MQFGSSAQKLLALSIGSLMTTATALQAGFILIPDLTAGGTATSSPTDTPVNEAPNFAFDDLSGTKGLIFNDVANDNVSPYEDVTSVNPVTWSYAFAGAAQATVQSYSLTSANDAQERDPRDFFLEGSNNGTTWSVIDTVTGHQFFEQPTVGDNTITTNRFETYFFTVDTPGSFSNYRLRVVETFGTTNDRPQIADIQLFATVVPEPGAAGLLLSAGALVCLRRRSARGR